MQSRTIFTSRSGSTLRSQVSDIQHLIPSNFSLRMHNSPPCYPYALAYGSSPPTSHIPFEDSYRTFQNAQYFDTPFENTFQSFPNTQDFDTPLENPYHSVPYAQSFGTPTETNVDVEMDIPVRLPTPTTPTIQPITDSTLVDLTEPYLMNWCTNSGPFMLMMQEWYD